MYGFQTSFGAPVFVQDDAGSYTSEVGMGGAAGDAFAAWLGANGKNGTGIISTTVDYDINNELFNTGQGAVHDPGPLGHRVVPGRPNLAVNPIPTAGGEAAAPFVGVQGFYLSSASKNALLAQEFLVNYLAHRRRAAGAVRGRPAHPGVDDDRRRGRPPTRSSPVSWPRPRTASRCRASPRWARSGSPWNAAQAQIINGADPVATWNTMVTDLEAQARRLTRSTGGGESAPAPGSPARRRQR